jgi:uncharacterized iron-regulated membrane protein
MVGTIEIARHCHSDLTKGGCGMQGDNPISWLMFFTLAATVFIVAGAFIYFLRSRTNREIAATTLEGDGSRIGATPNGAGVELVGFTVLALAVMGLLVAGYHGKSRTETAQIPTPVAGSTTGMAQPPGLPDQPKPYQPSNPSPDPRAAPTSSSTGAGSDNGSTGQPK